MGETRVDFCFISLRICEMLILEQLKKQSSPR